MKRTLFALAGVALVVTGNFTAQAIDADPNQKYEVVPAAGPWMICAASYSGEDASDIAHRLVLDIRRAYNLPAYVFNRGAEERRKQQEEIRRIRDLCPEGKVRVSRIEEQFAVLVGGYKDMDSARKALDGFKQLKPIDTRAMDTVTWSEKAVQDGAQGTLVKTARISPFMRAFVVRNPTVTTEEAQRDRAPDPALAKLNEGEPYSIYKNRKPWTLAVAVFASPGIVQAESSPSIIGKLLGEPSGEGLSAAGVNAHNLADLLRKQNFEAYVFHTRYNSVVCIGGFDSNNDPKLLRMADHPQFRAADQRANNVFLPNPLPLEVPR